MGSAFLTGATGSLGGPLLGRIIASGAFSTVYCLVRPSAGLSAQERLEKIRAGSDVAGVSAAQAGTQVRCIPGDMDQPNMGIAEPTSRSLAAEVDTIFHLAANVDFALELKESRRFNVESTRRILDFAHSCKLGGNAHSRLNYVSTAYVAGKTKGTLLESNGHENTDSFWNAYEQSKCEAEALVRAELNELPTTIYRPSQIVGDSQTGRVEKYFGFYEFVALGARRRTNLLVGDPNARPDMIPVDYISDAIAALSTLQETVGGTYHLAAGLQNSLTVNEVVDQVVAVIEEGLPEGQRFSKPAIVPQELLKSTLNEKELSAYETSPLKLLLRSYLPYLSHSRDFDVSATHKLLTSLGLPVPDMAKAISRTTRYALTERERSTQIRRQASAKLRASQQ